MTRISIRRVTCILRRVECSVQRVACKAILFFEYIENDFDYAAMPVETAVWEMATGCKASVRLRHSKAGGSKRSTVRWNTHQLAFANSKNVLRLHWFARSHSGVDPAAPPRHVMLFHVTHFPPCIYRRSASTDGHVWKAVASILLLVLKRDLFSFVLFQSIPDEVSSICHFLR